MRNHFIRQFHQTRKLFHPRMAQVFHIEYQPKKNYLYAIQERIEGTTLEQYILGQKQGQNSLLSATEGLQFLLGMLSFLQIAHEQTGLHFRLLASDIIWYPETPTEWRVLRARCDHPYQEGEGLKAITHSEEVLATAQMLFQAMSGERTIRPNVPLSQQNPTVPATLDDVFFQAFSRDPNTRFGDVASFEEAYTAALRSSPDTPPQPASYSATLTAVPYSSQTISLEPPQQTQSFLAHMSQIVSASLDQQGNSLLTIGRDRQCKWWEPTSGQLIHSLLIDDATLQTASQSRCGRLFAFCKRNSLVEVRYAGESSPLCSLQHKSSVVALAWSANDPLLYVSTSDGLIHTWQIPSGTRVCLWDEANQPAQQMHISPNGKLMASLHKQQGMKLWSTGTKQWLFDLPQTSGHLTALAFSPETPHAPTQSLLFTGHADGTAILWDYQLGIQLQQYQLGDTGLTWMEVNADGSRLLTINKRGECAIWPLDEDSIPGNPSVLENGHEGVSSAFFVPNSNSLVLCHKDAYLSLWQTN
jgi:WD40 repeat protein